MVFNYQSAGAAGFAFRVKAYPLAFPQTEEENTVGILSPEAPARYAFANARPEGAVPEGTVWIRTGAASPAPVRATGSGSILLYPLAAEQYRQGLWTPCAAKTFSGGAWRSWEKRLYTSSETGGTENVPWTGVNYSAIDNENGYIRVGRTNAQSSIGRAYTSGRVDVTDYRTLYVDYVRDQGDSGGGIRAGIGDTQSDSVFNASATGESKVRGTLAVDISGQSGAQYVKLANALGSNVKKLVYVFNVWMEG